jgi:membrane protein
MEQARGFFREIIKLIKKPEMRILPGQLAFFLVMSIIPTIALVGVIANQLSIPLDTIKITISNSIPKEISKFITDILVGQGFNFNIAVFFISAFILASNGPHSMIITSNEIYKIKPETVIKRRLKAIWMTFILVGLFLFLFIVPVCGDSIFAVIRYYVKDQTPINIIHQVYQLLKYPITILVLYFNIKLIYIISPDEKIKSVSTRKGAMFTTIGWVIATEIFSFYIGTFASYDIFYGSISNLLVILLWVYILSYIFVLGMALNAGNYNHQKLEERLKTYE